MPPTWMRSCATSVSAMHRSSPLAKHPRPKRPRRRFSRAPADWRKIAAEIELAELFFSADPAARRMLLMSLGSAAAAKPQGAPPAGTIQALEAAALGRDRGTFTKLLGNALGLSQAQAERIVADPAGEPLLVAAKALAMPSVTLQRVLMFIDPAISE